MERGRWVSKNGSGPERQKVDELAVVEGRVAESGC